MPFAVVTSAGEPPDMRESSFDWNAGGHAPIGDAPAGGRAPSIPPAGVRFGERARGVKVVDETLRDGLQSVSGYNAPVELKIDLLHAMAGIGVDVVSVGLPAAGDRNAEDTYRLCREIADAKLPLTPTAAARTVAADVEGIARASPSAPASPIEVYAFIGSSPIRQQVEGWDDRLPRRLRRRRGARGGEGRPLASVSSPRTRRARTPTSCATLFRAAIGEGAKRLCLCDTTGHVTPYGVEELVAFARGETRGDRRAPRRARLARATTIAGSRSRPRSGPRRTASSASTAPASASASASATPRSSSSSRTSASSARVVRRRARASSSTASSPPAPSRGRSRTTTRSPARASTPRRTSRAYRVARPRDPEQPVAEPPGPAHASASAARRSSSPSTRGAPCSRRSATISISSAPSKAATRATAARAPSCSTATPSSRA